MLTTAKLLAAVTIALGVIAVQVVDSTMFRLPRF